MAAKCSQAERLIPSHRALASMRPRSAVSDRMLTTILPGSSGRVARLALEMKASALASTGLRTLIVIVPVYVEIIEDTPGQWSGNCFGLDIYSTAWSEDRIAEHYRDLMERQVVIELAGGVAEAIYRGERREEEVLRFAIRHCCIGTDLKRARAVLGDLRRLTGVRFDAQPFAERARALLLTHWRAVTALASALVEDRRIEGDRVEAITHAARVETAAYSFQISDASFQSFPTFSQTTTYFPVTSCGEGDLVLKLKVPISRAALGPSDLTSKVVSFGSPTLSAMLLNIAPMAAPPCTIAEPCGNAVASVV